MLEDTPEIVKDVIDVASVTILGAVLLKILSDLAVILTVLWLIVRLYESKTYKRVSGWIIKKIRGKK
jgi:hypothetical protein